MILLRNLKIHQKLIIIFTVFGGIMTITSTFITFINELSLEEKNLVRNAELQAKLISEYCALPLDFNYPDEALEILQKLKNIKNVSSALLLNASDSVFARYDRDTESEHLSLYISMNEGHYLHDNHLHVLQPIYLEGNQIGKLYMMVDTKMNELIKERLYTALLLFFVLFIFTILLAWLVQIVIAQPIINLTSITQIISKKNDYKTDISRLGEDEISKLYNSFNQMMKTIHNRDEKLQETIKALSASELRFRSLVSNQTGVVYRANVDQHWTMSYISPQIEDLSGYKAEHFINNNKLSYKDIIFKEDIEEVLKDVKDRFKLEYRIVTANSALKWVHEQGQIINDEESGLSWIDGVIIDITDRKLQEQELLEKNEELERFTYTVSHDLKSPLVTIKAFTGYLPSDIKKGDEVRINKDLHFIQNAAEKMSQLLDELLELSRIGRKVNPPKTMNFEILVNEVLQLVAGRIEKAKINIKLNIAPVNITGDIPRLTEVLQNLIDNAAKFTSDSENPTIEIGTLIEQGNTIFYVKDNGIGIDPRYMHKLFGLFEKLDAHSDGTGIGLALVKRIVELHNGKVWAESEGLGKGTTFKFKIGNTFTPKNTAALYQ